MKIAAVGDLHAREISKGNFGELFRPLIGKADILLLCGDLTAYGQPAEAEQLGTELAIFQIPILAVLGNHDFDNNHQEEIKDTLRQHKITVLDGDYFVHQGIGFAGVKGFGGGFGSHLLPAFGEEANKQFAKEAANEASKLESALVRLPTKEKVVLLHYSPVRETVEGEPPDIIPFLGSTHLEEPLNNFGVRVVFHGHAEHGSLKGKTSGGTPVYNVALPLLKRQAHPTPYLLFEL